MTSATKTQSEMLMLEDAGIRLSKHFSQPIVTARRHFIDAIKVDFLCNGRGFLSYGNMDYIFRDSVKFTQKHKGMLGCLKIILDLEILVFLGQVFCYAQQEHIIEPLVFTVKRRLLEIDSDNIDTMVFTQLCIDSVKRNRPTSLRSFFQLIVNIPLDAVREIMQQNRECDLDKLKEMSKTHALEVYDVEAHDRQCMGEVVFNCINYSLDRAFVVHDTTRGAVVEACKQKLADLEQEMTRS